MQTRYLIPKQAVFRVEEEIKRSRFITTIAHTNSVLNAKEFIATIKKEFPDATHNCSAYAAGPPGDTAFIGCSDDGEPVGTAGRPMLHTILHSNVGELGVVVTRYFGGIKLGAGGLVRAYSGVVANALAELPVKEKIIPARLRLLVPHTYTTKCKRLFEKYEVQIEAEVFGHDAEFDLTLPQEHEENLKAELINLTAGQVIIV